jgi:Tfp pilus assembly ATPase PilU
MTNSCRPLPENSFFRRPWWISAGTVVALLCFAFVASPRPPQATDFVLEGKITRKVQDKLTVNTVQNIVFTVRYTDKTEIKKTDDSAASPVDLKVGVRIRVEGQLTESGEVLAVRIKLLE